MLRRRLPCVLLLLSVAVPGPVVADPPGVANPIREVTIRAPRDMGFFQGDLVRAAVDIVVADGWDLDTASLPHPGPVNYWLDLRSIATTRRLAGSGSTRTTLNILYQDFYDALDARPQEIPAFEVAFRHGGEMRSAYVPAWTIGVSPLREVAPPLKDDPRDYMRADGPAPLIRTDPIWIGTAVAALAAVLTLLLLLYDRGSWPFHARTARAFGTAARRMRRLAPRADTDAGYLEALLLVHRGIDETDGRRVLADDLASFITRNPVFTPSRDGLSHFFAASRHAFFGSDPARSRATMPFLALDRLARRLAAAERAR